ncbi:glycosyl transferase [Superficieibacter electus]|uniref:Glycosyl transferase n=1 Tax=Superficieibacter electus TaxID=2022662 RepID=A0A2P5GU83_9ENTR|nr:glycosyltransferase [Superficieibacter electus]POP47275.1 glycosyl transferase [Superficieibacter electus]POP50122.1 glycosyl transferase [Superficieibacter electus]
MIAIALFWLAILLFKLWFALKMLYTPAQSSPHDISDVSVMQPILSGDPALSAVLASNLHNLPEAHFLWLLDDDDEQGWRVARALQQCHPQCDITLLRYPTAPEGWNPKLYKLEQARAQVKTRWMMVLDDDVTLSAASLHSMLSQLTAQNLVTALPWYRAADNLSSRLLAQFVNDNAALTYLPLLPFAPPLTLNGMCYILPLAVLEQVGGFAPVMRHLTDDLALATLLTREKVNIVQSVAPVQVQTSVPDLRRYSRQMHRWFLFATLLMREKSLAVNLAIFILQGLHPLLLWVMLILTCNGGAFEVVTLAMVLAIRHAGLRRVQRAVSGQIPSHPLLSLLSELLQPVHLCHAIFKRTVHWRSRRYRIFSNDRFTSR